MQFLLEESGKSAGGGILNLDRALMYASARGYEEITKSLVGHIQRSGQLFPSDPRLLYQVSELGYFALVGLFVDGGANVDAACEGTTPLQSAAKNGHSSIVSFLISRGVDINSNAASDSTKPLVYGIKYGHENVVRQLLSSRDVDTGVVDEKQRTPLHLAAYLGQYEVVKLLLIHHTKSSKENNSYSMGL